MKLDECGICQLLPNKKRIFETKYWEIIIAPDQGYLGRCYVTLKKHKGDLAELTREEWLDYADIVKKLEQAIRLAFGAVVFNWGCLMNNAYQEELVTPHVHWHVRPRYSKSVTFTGLEFTDPEFGHHYNRERRRKVEEDELSAIKKEIQDNLD